MSWARFDDQMAFHSKIVAAGNAAVGAWARMICWSSAHRTNGAVPKPIALMIAKSQRVIDQGLASGLFHDRGEAIEIHDFLDWNPTGEEVERRRTLRAQSGRLGGLQKAAKQAGAAVASASPLAKQKSAPSPSPSPVSRLPENQDVRVGLADEDQELTQIFSSVEGIDPARMVGALRNMEVAQGKPPGVTLVAVARSAAAQLAAKRAGGPLTEPAPYLAKILGRLLRPGELAKSEPKRETAEDYKVRPWSTAK